jgi:hypothetical protein
MNVRIALAALLVFAPALTWGQSVFDGSWMVQNEDKTLDLNSVVTFKVGREVAELSTLSGITYKAKLNGADAKVDGDPKTTTVSVTRPSKNVLLEISKRDGKPWLSMRMAVEPDGKTAKVTWKNLNTDKGGSYDLAKQ